MGTPRSGTRYIRYALYHCGLDVHQERMGPDGIVCGFWAWSDETARGGPPYTLPGSHQMYWKGGHPIVQYAGEQFEHRFHYVRNPLDVMRTLPLVFREDVYGPWLRKLGIQGRGLWNRKLAALRYWIVTHEKLIEMDLPVVRIEYIETDWREFSDRLALPPCPLPADKPVPPRAEQPPLVTWDDLAAWDHRLAKRAAELAWHFGYL